MLGCDVVLTIKEVAEKYKAGESTVYLWMKQGLPRYKIGRSTRFDETEVDEWVRKVKSRKEA